MSKDKKRGQVLVVDDDPLTVKTLKMILNTQNLEVATATSAHEGKQVLLELGLPHFDCILTDYRMPKMTGLEFMEWVHGHDATLSTIILTGEGDKRLVESALRGGAADYLEKPFGIHQIASAIDKAMEQTRKNRALQSTASDVKALGAVRQRLNKSTIIPINDDQGLAFNITARVYPTKETGGDFYNTWQVSDKTVFILTGDVSGHDLRAGYISAYFQGMARGMLETGTDMKRISAFFNRYLDKEWNRTDGDFSIRTSLACCCLMFHLDKQVLEVHNNGLPQPFLANANTMQLIGETAPPLGWFEDIMTEVTSTPLEPKGYCYLWSDGLDEFAQRRNITPHALAYFLYKENNDKARLGILEGRHDDILLLRADWSLDNNTAPPQEVLIDAAYPGHREGEIDSYQLCWEESLRLVLPQLSNEAIFKVLLCLREGLLNAFQHGCKGRSEVRCYLRLTLDVATETLHATITDDGEGYDRAPHSESQPREDGHISYGLILIHAHATKVQTDNHGKILQMQFDLNHLCEHHP